MSEVLAKDLVSSNPPERIMSSILQYSLMPQPDADRFDGVIATAIQRAYGDQITGHGFLRTTGGKLASSMLSFPTYAAPEALGAKAAMQAEIAGERIVAGVAKQLCEDLDTPRYRAVKRIFGFEPGVCASAAESYVTTPRIATVIRSFDHEPTRGPENAYAKGVIGALLAHNVSQVVFTGSGAIDRKNHKFLVSPRLYETSVVISNIPVHKRPLVSQLSSMHYEGFGQYYNLTGDANMSPWAIFMRFAGTSALLRLIEHEAHHPLAMMSPADPVAAAREVAADPTLQARFLTVGGRRVGAVDVQEEAAQRLLKLAEHVALPREEVDAARERLKLCDAMRKDSDFGYGKIEWRTKYRNIQNAIANEGLTSVADIRLAKMDLMHTILSPELLVMLGGARKVFPMIPSHKTVLAGTLEPPKGTRAERRTDALRAYTGSLTTCSIGWATKNETVDLRNPYNIG